MSNTHTAETANQVIDQVKNVAQHAIGCTDHLVGSDTVCTDAASVQTVDDLLAQLSSEAFEVMGKYFGLTGDDPLSAREISLSVGLSEERVLEVINQALRQLREFDSADELERKVA
jgi:DNA-directed RNA polymerase sigma subunit (sigma70/sigma32)